MEEKKPLSERLKTNWWPVLITLLLITSLIFMINEISGVFQPLGVALDIILPPFILAMVLYYMFNPIVDFLERRGLDRRIAILLVFALMILIIVAIVAIIIPIVRDQFNQLIENWDIYEQTILDWAERFNVDEILDRILQYLNSINFERTIYNNISNIVGGIGSALGIIVSIAVVIFTAPIVLFYLFMEGDDFPEKWTVKLSDKWERRLNDLLNEANFKMAGFIRGQLIVSLVVALIFFVGFNIIGLDYAFLLSIIAGVLNLIPYLGSFTAFVLALIIAAFTSPWMVLATIIVFIVEQFIEGRIVSPLVLGNRLDIHPLTILFVLLVAGNLGGAIGLFLAVPIYTLIKILIKHLLKWREESLAS